MAVVGRFQPSAGVLAFCPLSSFALKKAVRRVLLLSVGFYPSFSFRGLHGPFLCAPRVFPALALVQLSCWLPASSGAFLVRPGFRPGVVGRRGRWSGCRIRGGPPAVFLSFLAAF